MTDSQLIAIKQLRDSITSLETSIAGPNEFTRPNPMVVLISLCRAVHKLCDILEEVPPSKATKRAKVEA